MFELSDQKKHKLLAAEFKHTMLSVDNLLETHWKPTALGLGQNGLNQYKQKIDIVSHKTEKSKNFKIN